MKTEGVGDLVSDRKMYLMPLNCTLKLVKMVAFMLAYFTTLKKKLKGKKPNTIDSPA